MRRREFISLLSGVAAASPIAARAQQPERTRRIGVLVNTAADDAGRASSSRCLPGGPARNWDGSIGGNVQIEVRWGAGNALFS